jgi:hypothetical protein
MSSQHVLRRDQLWQRDDRGSLPLAILFATIVLLISTVVGSSVAWQLKTITQQENAQDARWAATSAINIALERMSLATPAMIAVADPPGVATTAAPSLLPPASMPYLETGATGAAARWWVQRTLDTNVVVLFAQGRAGLDMTPAYDALTLVLTYNPAQGLWIPGTIQAAPDGVPTG